MILVLRALALQRTPGFNFPGHFLQLAYDRVERGHTVLSLDTEPHCADRDGQMNVGALALLADMGLAATLRGDVGPSARVATVHMNLQLTGAPRTGRLVAESRFDGFLVKGAERQGLARIELKAGGRLVCTGSGAFMVIGKADATPPHPLPPRGGLSAEPLDPSRLTAPEADVLAHARRAMRDDGRHGFLERFWDYKPRRTKTGASCRAWNGMHIGNRVGHAQGGVSFGLAASTAMAALPATWTLVGASAWYVSPGTGRTLAARSRIVHHGSLTAVVRTRITDERGRAVLEMTTSHART